MKSRFVLFVRFALIAALLPDSVASQPAPTAVIVVFHDDASFREFPAARPDARAQQNPTAWRYLTPSVFGAVQLLEDQHGFRADHVYTATVRGFAARLTNGQINALRNDPLVAYIEPDGPIQPLEQEIPWGVDRIDADLSSVKAGDGTGSVNNVNVYVLDAGVDQAHPDLNVVAHVNFTSTPNTATCAHGTRVAGVIAARDNDTGVVGVLPGAPITAVKVVACDPVISSMSSAIKGVDWVTANAIRPAVANMSIGGFVNSTLDTAVKRSADSGVFYAIAAGNSATDACWTSPQRAGTHPGVVTVAATDHTDAEAAFSSFGRCVDIWGPGVDILTTDLGGGTTTSSGTSYAAPHVAGTVGIGLSRYPSAPPSQAETALKNFAVVTTQVSRDGRTVKIVYAGKW